MEFVKVERPADTNVIIGQSHFIKTAEDLYEAMVNAVPSARFGVAFCEASGPRLVRVEGNDPELRSCAAKNAQRIGAGHSFVIVMRDCYPVNVLRSVKDVPEVCNIYCATANDLEVVVVSNDRGRGIVGVIDGQPPLGVETDDNVKERREFLRRIGYKR
jgi:adenosine/AMP kinase